MKGITQLAQRIKGPGDTIAFDYELSRGIAAYNEEVGHWWSNQAADSIHGYAYRNIADFICSSLADPPGLIVDYACGPGNLLSRFHRRFPFSRLMGLDGSSFLLGLARRRMAQLGQCALRQVRLVETLLPNFELPSAVADLVVFVFPNMVPCSAQDDGLRCAHRLRAVDTAVARELACCPDPDNPAVGDDPQTVYSTLLRGRLVSLNIRRLLKRGGLCMRVEYGHVRREELSQMELLRTAFEEGSLDQETNGKVPEQWFRVLASRFFRSGVMQDVYHQSQDESDRTGGYFITVLRAL